MRRGILLLTLLLLLSGQVWAAELTDTQAALWGADRLEQALPEQAMDTLERTDAAAQPAASGILSIFSDAISRNGSSLRTAASLMLRLLAIVVVCTLAQSNQAQPQKQASAMAGAMAVTACCITDLRSMIGLGRQTIEEIMAFSSMLIPVMASAAAASGAVTSAGLLSPVTTVFSNLLMRFSTQVLLPVLYGYLALALVDSALQERRLQPLQALLRWIIRTGLRIVMYVYTGFLAVSGVISGNADAAALKAAKVTLSGMVPVVGSIISDAADTVLASAGMLRGTVGTFGMLAVLAIFLTPFLRMGIQLLAFKLTSALSSLLDSRLNTLLDAMSEAMGFLLAMTGSSMLMCLISCCCLMQVHGT